MKRKFFQKVMIVVCVLSLLAGAMITPVGAREEQVISMTTLPPMQDFFAGETSVPVDGTVELIDGVAERWIDRVKLPASILSLYDKLVEGVDNDGEADILIEDQYYNDPEFVIEVAKETIPLNGKTVETVLQETEDRYMPYLYTVFGAFDRDHPEVFWLNNSWRVGSSGSSNGTTCTVTILVGISQIRAEGYLTETAIKAGIAARDAAVAEICRGFTWETTRYERILHFNDVLTKTNQYNTSANLSGIGHECRECIGALWGRVGTEGPVCEAYARAFKVLCDVNDIPCVLVDGLGLMTSPGERHMWNYVQIDDAWYGVDVTWNDPVSSGSVGAVSGHESQEWLLVGADTKVKGKTFLATHQMNNQVYTGFMGFTNGPALSASAYDTALTVALNLPEGGYVYDGTAKTPQAVVKYRGVVLTPDTHYSITYSNNRDAGTATVHVTGKGLYNGSITVTFPIQKRALAPQITVGEKIYDGTDTAELTVVLDATKIVSGDTVRVSGGGVFASPDAGEAVKILTDLTLEGTGSENYELQLPRELTAPIARRNVTVRAEAKEIQKNDPPSLSYTVDPETPLVPGERLVGMLNFDPNGTDGVYPIIQGTLTNENNPNYNITFVSATLTILSDKEEGSSDGSKDPILPDSTEVEELLSLLTNVDPKWVAIGGGGAALALVVILILAVVLRKRR